MSQIENLSLNEMDEVNGGIVPIVVIAAAAATGVEFAFVIGIFAGIREKYG